MWLIILGDQTSATIPKNAQTVEHKFESAYGDDSGRKFLHTDHSKNQHYLCKKCDVSNVPEYNQALTRDLV